MTSPRLAQYNPARVAAPAAGDYSGISLTHFPKTIDMPFVETFEQAWHFKDGPGAYEGGMYPYSQPITSPYRERLEKGLPAFDSADGDFPWKQDWFPGKD